MCFLAKSATVAGFERVFRQAAPFPSFHYCVPPLNPLLVQRTGPYRPSTPARNTGSSNIQPVGLPTDMYYTGYPIFTSEGFCSLQDGMCPVFKIKFAFRLNLASISVCVPVCVTVCVTVCCTQGAVVGPWGRCAQLLWNDDDEARRLASRFLWLWRHMLKGD